jgi:hypothetical protein
MWGCADFIKLSLLLLLFSIIVTYTCITRFSHLPSSKFKYYNRKKIIPFRDKNEWEVDSLQQVFFKPYLGEINNNLT